MWNNILNKLLTLEVLISNLLVKKRRPFLGSFFQTILHHLEPEIDMPKTFL